MKRCFGIVAEFNPFHNGHAALCKAARQQGADYIAAVMSGNFVQRGSLAITDKRVRTKAALLCGVDVVLELPLPFATATAQTFAAGAVGILRAFGAVDTLCFGSECGDISLLRSAANAVDAPEVHQLIRERSHEGMTYAKARQMAVEELYGPEIAGCLASPNNILAVEYLRQAKQQGWNVDAVTIPRIQAGHDSLHPGESVASASYIRAHGGEMERYVPQKALTVYREAEAQGLLPAVPDRLETAILARLRSLPRQQLSELPDLSEGLEHRLYNSIRKATSMEELEQMLKTKRYPLARIRRLILAAFLGVQKSDTEALPPYTRVLGLGKNGSEVLSFTETGTLPIHTSLAHLERLGPKCHRMAALEAAATDTYTLALPNPQPCGLEYTASAVFLK